MLKFAALRPSQSPLFVLKFDLLLATRTSPTTLNSQASSLIYRIATLTTMSCGYPNQVNTKDKLTKDNIKPFSSENSGESSDQPENDLPVVKPDAAIQSGSKWGTAEDLTAAEWMFDMVKTIAPSARKPNFAGWANDIRLMRERDGRNHRDMCVLFRWACQDNFWSGNVLSPAKLRDKWTQLEINRNKQQAGVTAGKPKLDLTNTDWIYGVDL